MARRELETRLVTFDTSALIPAINRNDPDHHRVLQVIQREPGPLLLPVGLLSEAAFLIEKLLGHRALEQFLASLTSGAFSLICGEGDLDRIHELVVRYRDLPLGYADAAVIACAERHGGKVMTLDLRHFGVVAREGTIEILP